MGNRKGTQLAASASGVILAFAGTTAPTGYLLCDGSEKLKTDYPALADICGSLYGTASDGDHFVLPDLRGRTLFGFDNMGGTPASRLASLDKIVPTNGAGELHYLLINYVIKT